MPTAADAWVDQLLSQGYCVLPDAQPADEAAGLARDLEAHFASTPFCDGDFYGRRTKRFGRLLTRSTRAAAFVQHPLVLEIVERLLRPFTDNVQLNLTQALQLYPGQRAQIPHRDEDMWRGPKGDVEYLVNVMWPTSAYTAENGATRVWPGSHVDRCIDPTACQPVVAEMEPGSALLFLGSTLHAAGANRTAQPRSGMIVSYCLGWLKPYENQWLAYPPSIARRFAPELAALVGYRLHRPNLGGYEGQCPSVLLRDDVPDHLAATDVLTPEAEAYLRSYLESARG